MLERRCAQRYTTRLLKPQSDTQVLTVWTISSPLYEPLMYEHVRRSQVSVPS